MTTSEKAAILSILRKTQLHCCFATADGAQPVVRSMAAIVDEEMNIWLATGAASRKVKQIRKNPRVALLFTSQPDGSLSALVIGRARIITDQNERAAAWKLAPYDIARYWPEGPTAKKFCLLRIIPSRIEWRDGWKETKVWRPR